MSDCEHGKVYYMDFANQPKAFEYCPLCQRDSARAERDRYRNALELLRPGIEIDLRCADPDDDIDALRSRAQTIREALSDE